MKNYLLYSFIAFTGGFLLFPNSGSTSVALSSKIPLIQINTEQRSSLEIGLDIGRKSKALFTDIERRYDTHLATTLNQDLFDKIQQETLPKLLKKLDLKYQEELKGVAGVWSLTHTNKLGDGLLSLDEYHVLNLLPDIGFSPDGTGFAVFSEVSAENGPIIGRNLDWVSTPELRSLQVITVYQSNYKSIVNIGFAGIISVLTGFNDQGLFLAHYKAEPYSLYKNIQPISESEHSQSTIFDLRKTLETSTSAQQATLYLSKKSYAYSHSILLADKKSIQVLEYPQGGTAKVRQWNSSTRFDKDWDKELQIAVIDCHVLSSMPNNCKDIKDSYRWQRLRQLAQFNILRPASMQDMRNILFDTNNHLFEIFNPETLQSMVYLPESGNLYLYTAAVESSRPISPVHKAYLGIIPSELRNLHFNSNRYIIWLIWSVLALLFAIMLWIRGSFNK